MSTLDIESLFGKMAAAPLNSKGSYMPEGKFTVKTVGIKVKDGFKGKSFICEFEVVGIQVCSDPNLKPGMTKSWVLKLDKPQAWGDMKKLFWALTGTEPKTVKDDPAQDPEKHNQATLCAKAAVDEEIAKANGFPADAFIGLTVKLETRQVDTRNGGKFTVHDWSPVEAAP